MASKWIQRGNKHPGAERSAAKRAGMGTMAYAREHYHDSGISGERARYAVNAQRSRKKRSRTKSRR